MWFLKRLAEWLDRRAAAKKCIPDKPNERPDHPWYR